MLCSAAHQRLLCTKGFAVKGCVPIAGCAVESSVGRFSLWTWTQRAATRRLKVCVLRAHGLRLPRHLASRRGAWRSSGPREAVVMRAARSPEGATCVWCRIHFVLGASTPHAMAPTVRVWVLVVWATRHPRRNSVSCTNMWMVAWPTSAGPRARSPRWGTPRVVALGLRAVLGRPRRTVQSRTSAVQMLHQREHGLVSSPQLAAHLGQVQAQVGHVPAEALVGAARGLRAASLIAQPVPRRLCLHEAPGPGTVSTRDEASVRSLWQHRACRRDHWLGHLVDDAQSPVAKSLDLAASRAHEGRLLVCEARAAMAEVS